METQYFQWLICFTPLASLAGALSTFYIGRGKVKFVTCVIIGANVINVFLDVFLIFGVESFIKPLGVVGAALATGISQTLQACILLVAFLRKKNRKRHGTNHWRFNKDLFKQCLKVGIPSAAAQTMELMAWVFILISWHY